LQVAKAKQHINPYFAVFSTRKTIRFCMVSPHFCTGFLGYNQDSFFAYEQEKHKKRRRFSGAVDRFSR
jgi:hypothetical protein